MLSFVKKSSDENKYPVMLRFRPIAPKPPGGEQVSGALEFENRNGGSGKNGVKRTKRKYVRVRDRQSKKKVTELSKSICSPPEKSQIEEEEDLSPKQSEIVTLQLLPERFESEKCEENTMDDYEVMAGVKKVINGGSIESKSFGSVIAETWIVVESVMDIATESGVKLGFSDRDKIEYLQEDTCPGFVSDGSNKVIWVNEAYRRMVGEEGEGVMVRLVVKKNLPYFCPSFACRVRLIQQTKQGQKWNKIVPCDVWRMEYAGFAWRLDVRAALGLGI